MFQREKQNRRGKRECKGKGLIFKKQSQRRLYWEDSIYRKDPQWVRGSYVQISGESVIGQSAQ